MSFWHFLVEGDSTDWIWVVLAGFSFGVGVQLHAILLLLMPVMVFLIVVFLLRSNSKCWKKIFAMLLVALILNIGQIISERENNFANSKIFLDAFVFKSQRTDSTLRRGLILDLACNAQADMHILTSLGNKNICDFLYGDTAESTTYATPIYISRNPLLLLGKITCLSFMILGISFLLFYFLLFL